MSKVKGTEKHQEKHIYQSFYYNKMQTTIPVQACEYITLLVTCRNITSLMIYFLDLEEQTQHFIQFTASMKHVNLFLNPCHTDGKFSCQVNPSLRYGHSCQWLIILIKMSTINHCQKSMVLEANRQQVLVVMVIECGNKCD